jgi:hypothetical protein
MIDLEEVARSFASCTLQLELQCLEYGLAIEAEPQPAGIEPQTMSRKDQVKVRVRQSCQEVAALSKLVGEKLIQLGADPEDLPKLINVSNRMVAAVQKAQALIEEHELREKAKNLPPAENPTAIAIRQFKERQGMIGKTSVRPG